MKTYGGRKSETCLNSQEHTYNKKGEEIQSSKAFSQIKYTLKADLWKYNEHTSQYTHETPIENYAVPSHKALEKGYGRLNKSRFSLFLLLPSPFPALHGVRILGAETHADLGSLVHVKAEI